MLDNPPLQSDAVTTATGGGTGPASAAGTELHIPSPRRLGLAAVIGALIGLCLAVIWLRMTVPEYTAKAIIGPTAQSGLVGMGLRVPQLATPGQITTPLEHRADELVSDFEHFRQTLDAPATARQIMADEAFMRRVSLGLWQPTREQWSVPDRSVAAVLAGLLRGSQGAEATASGQVSFRAMINDDGEYLADWLSDHLAIRRIGETAMYRVSLRHPDRSVALELVTRLLRLTDAGLRQEAQRRVETQIAHLREQMEQAQLASHREAMNRLLTEQLQIAMMLAVDLPFAADIIEPPSALRMPDWPAPLPVAGLALLAGACLGIGCAVALANRRREADNA